MGVGQWMSAPNAFSLLLLAAALLAVLLPCGLWPRPMPRTQALLAASGLLLAVSAAEFLKLKTNSDIAPGTHFAAMRNFQSLAYAAIPLALGLLLHPRSARAASLLFGLLGAWMFASWLRPGDAPWALAMRAEDHVAAADMPIFRRLTGAPDQQTARWIWFAGAALAAAPLWRVFHPATRRLMLTSADPMALACVLAGLGISASTMGIFFWYPADWWYRQFVLQFLESAALVAIALRLTHSRFVTAAWMRLGMSCLSAVLALWLGTGLLGGDLAGARQHLGDELPALLFVLLLLLIPAVLLVHALAVGLLALLRARPAPSAT